MSEIISRKNAHLDICLYNSRIETGKTYLSDIHLIHHALPSVNMSDINTTISFLGMPICAPLFISCMTGGTQKGYSFNTYFAEAAEECKIPLGIGSIRALIENKDIISEFKLKRIAPSVPFIANIGATQLKTISFSVLNDFLMEIEADALVLHLNPAQELCQKGGERSFSHVLDYIQEYTHYCPIPLIVKETGCGMTPHEVHTLLGIGIRYVDIAGSGGTNWAMVELLREYESSSEENMCGSHLYSSVMQWGNPTALMLLALCGSTECVLSSGGIRNAHDIAVSLALGAKAVGMALPILHHAKKGSNHLIRYIYSIIEQLKHIMLLCNVSSISEMKNVQLWIDPSLQQKLVSFCKACNISVPKKFT